MTKAPGDPRDPRAIALGAFLRDRTALFYLSADVNGSAHIAAAGMSLLEAADVAEELQTRDPLLIEMPERGLFESMPDGAARVPASDEIGRSLSRSILGKARDRRIVLRDLVTALPPWTPT